MGNYIYQSRRLEKCITIEFYKNFRNIMIVFVEKLRFQLFQMHFDTMMHPK